MCSENNTIRRIFLTHCSAKKDDSFKENNFQVTPDRLYTATVTQRFMNKCKNAKANGLYSQKYMVFGSLISNIHGMRRIQIK